MVCLCCWSRRIAEVWPWQTRMYARPCGWTMVSAMTTPFGPAGTDVRAGLSNSDVNELLLAAGRAVDSAARLLVQGRSHLGALIAKGDRDYASRVDFQIE